MTSHLAPQVLNTFAAQMLPQMSMTNVQQSKKNAKAKLAALPDLPYRKAWWGCQWAAKGLANPDMPDWQVGYTTEHYE
jgi:hypothetical protein